MQIKELLSNGYDLGRSQFLWKSSDFFYMLLASFLFLFFRIHFIQVFDDFFVNGFLSKVYKELSDTEVALALALAACLGYWSYKSLYQTKYKVSLLTLYFPVLACCCYGFERVSMENYDLAPLVSHPFKVYQTDLLFLLLLFIVGIKISNIFVLTGIPKNMGILKQDVPLNDFRDDEFNREAYVRRLIDELHSVDLLHAKSFIVGVNSPWGMGKTSILLAFKNVISQTGRNVCIEYNPWLSSHKKGLTFDFFVHLENTLSKYLETSNLIIEYGSKVAEVDHGSNPLKAISHLFKKERSLEGIFNKISDLILSLHRKIYVIIDDLDRLDNSEVMKILQLVRNTANFPNIVFIVAYDKEYLINALGVNKIYCPEKYIEKIFDLELVLPVIEDIKIRESLKKTILQGLSTMTLTAIEKQNYEDQLYKLIFSKSANFNSTRFEIVSNNLLSIVKNKRDIIKISNSFLLSLKLNKKLVYMPDLFILELVKYASSLTYMKLATNDRYLDIDTEYGFRTYRLHPSPKSDLNAFREPLFNLLNDIENQAVKRLVSALFSSIDVHDFQSDRSIQIVDNYYSYFLFAIPEGGIDPELVDSLIFS